MKKEVGSAMTETKKLVSKFVVAIIGGIIFSYLVAWGLTEDPNPLNLKWYQLLIVAFIFVHRVVVNLYKKQISELLSVDSSKLDAAEAVAKSQRK